MLDQAYLDKIGEYFASGDLAFDFDNADDARRGDILEFLEKLMDLAEEADALATKLIFRDQKRPPERAAGTPTSPSYSSCPARTQTPPALASSGVHRSETPAGSG